MSIKKVSNPIPKDTKTINDVLSSVDSTIERPQKKPLEIKRVSSKSRMSGDENNDKSQYDNSYVDK